MARYAQDSGGCLDDNAFSVKFSHTIPGVIYYDEYGVEDFRIDPITAFSTYKLNKEFTLACDDLCNKQGVLVMQAMGVNSNFKTYRLMSVFRAIDELNKTYECRSNERKQFEQNMLKMWQEERKVPANLKRTLQHVLQQ